MDPVEIFVTGYAEFPQISIALPRPEIHSDTELAYKAIGSITTGYLRILKDNVIDENFQSGYVGNTEDMDLETYKHLISQGWIIISKKVRILIIRLARM